MGHILRGILYVAIYTDEVVIIRVDFDKNRGFIIIDRIIHSAGKAVLRTIVTGIKTGGIPSQCNNKLFRNSIYALIGRYFGIFLDYMAALAFLMLISGRIKGGLKVGHPFVGVSMLRLHGRHAPHKGGEKEDQDKDNSCGFH